MAKNKITKSFALDPDVARDLEALAKVEGLSASALANRLLSDAVRERAASAKVLSNPVVMQAFGKAFSAPGVLSSMIEAIGQKLDDEQLRLFRDTLESVTRLGGDAPKPPVKSKRKK